MITSAIIGGLLETQPTRSIAVRVRGGTIKVLLVPRKRTVNSAKYKRILCSVFGDAIAKSAPTVRHRQPQ
jgi:hypothetical protein